MQGLSTCPCSSPVLGLVAISAKQEWSWPGGYWGGHQRESALLQISLVPLNGV